MIHIQNLTHTYRNRGEEALKDINIEIGRGENVVMIGSSGSGKSTLLKAINGLIKPSSGRILIDNICIGEFFEHFKIYTFNNTIY